MNPLYWLYSSTARGLRLGTLRSQYSNNGSFAKSVLLFLLCAGSTLAQDEVRLDFGLPGRTALGPGRTAEPIRLLNKQAGRAEFESAAETATAYKATLNQQAWVRLELDNGSTGGETGEPQIPYYGKFIRVPEGAAVKLVIDGIQWNTVAGEFTVQPRQEAPPDAVGAGSPPFRQSLAAYQVDSFLPDNPVRIADRMKIRHADMVYVVYTPLMYNPARSQLKAAPVVRWHLEFSEPAASIGAEPRGDDALGEQAFAPLTSQAVDARTPTEPAPSNITPQLTAGNGADYLVIVDDDYYNEILPLAEWKHQRGLKTRVVRVSSIAGSGTAADIAAYIKSAFQNWSPSPTYVLLVGDSQNIPAHYKNTHPYHGTKTATDLYYATVSGTDIFPDLFLGRLPCASAAECTRMVNKILEAERTPFLNSAYYDTVLVAGYFQDTDDGDPLDGYEARLFVETAQAVGGFMNNQGYTVKTSYTKESNITPRRHNRNSLLHTNGAVYTTSPTYLSASGAASAVSNAVNAGAWLVQHRDHGSKSGWGDPPFGTGDVDALANSNKYPIVMTINCMTAWFDDTSFNSFGERWLKKAVGGSHSVIGATRVSYSWWNDWFVHGMYEAMFPNYMETLATLPGYKPGLSYGNNFVGKGDHLGQVLNYGKMVMYDKYAGGSQSGTCLVQFEIMTLLGDPEFTPRSTYPYAISATHPATLRSTVPTNFTVNVTSQSSPLSGARVALVRDPYDYRVGTSDASGNVNFSFTPSTPPPGSNYMTIVVTHPDRRPYTNQILIETLGMVVSLPTSATEGAGTVVNGGRVTIPASRPSSLTVSLSSDDTSEVTVPASVIIPAGATFADFSFTVVNDTVLDGPQYVGIMAAATGYGEATDTIRINDNERATLTVTLPARPMRETSLASKASVAISMVPEYELLVNLTSSDTSEATVPASVTIHEGRTNATFNITPVDDNEIDGTRTVTVTASASGQNSGTDTVQILDNETTVLVFTTVPAAMEGNGTILNAGRVEIDGTLTTNLVVPLASSDTSEATVPASVSIPAGALTASFAITIQDDALVDGPQVAQIRATPFGFTWRTNVLTVYDNESPPPAVDPTPADLASNVVVTTPLAWQYFGGVGTGVSNDVYLGLSPALGPSDLRVTTTATTWTPPRLAPMMTYYWKVVTRRGALSTPGPVWSFSTRGLHHFTWSSITSPQMAVNPFGAILSARDEFNTVVSNFTEAVELRGLVGSPAATLWSDTFEDGNYTGWTVQSGTYVRVVTNETSSQGIYSLRLTGGNGTHTDGLTRTLASLRPEIVKFSVRLARNDAYAGYVVLGDSADVGSAAAFFYARPDATLGLYENVVGPHTAPYTSNVWYAVKLVFDWDTRRIHYYLNDNLVEADIPFRSATVASLTRLDVYNFDSTTAWYDDFQIISSNNVTEVAITPNETGTFVNGYWSGSVTVLAPASNMVLQARSDAGVEGLSARFDVIPNTRPALSIRSTGVVEGDQGSRTASFLVSLSPVANTNVTVQWSTFGGTASNGVDYVSAAGELSFNPGVSSRSFSVSVLGDNLVEGDEIFYAQLANPFNALLSNNVAACTIWDDEIAPNILLTSAAGFPWDLDDDLEYMDQVFGSNWVRFDMETVNSNLLFSSAVKFIYMNGSASLADEQEAFLSRNLSRMNSWIYGGGCAFVNSGPNEGNGMSLPLSNLLEYPDYSATGRVAFASHPIFATPFTPVGTEWRGNYFAHATLIGNGIVPLITDRWDTNKVLLGEEAYGAGNLVMGGMTMPFFHTPGPEAVNLRRNTIAWAARPLPFVNIGNGFIVEGNSGTTNLVFRVQLSRAFDTNVFVRFNTSSVTAAAGSDYFATNGVLNFVPGVTELLLPVRVIGDVIAEADETFNMLLLSVTNGVLQDASGSGLIGDDDQPPYAYVRSSVGEPWSTTSMTNGLNRVFGPGGWRSYFFQSTPGEAVFSPAIRFVYLEGGDHAALELKDFIAANYSTMRDWVAQGGNLLINAAPNEGADIDLNFNVNLNYPDSGRTGVVFQTTHPIVNGPFTPVGTSWSGGSFAHATIQGASMPLIVNSTNSSEVMLAEQAYGNGNVVFGALTPYNYHSPAQQASNLFGNILSWASDPKPYASVANTMSVEGNSGTSNMMFTVSLNRPYAADVTVGFTTVSGTATIGSDFVGTNGSAMIPAGATAITVPVRIIGDLTKEGHETFTFRLNSAVNAVILNADATGTILDNEVPAYVYLRSSSGEPWGRLNNSNAMNNAFGVGKWQTLHYETVDPATLFSPVTRFVFLEGSDNSAAPFETFLNSHLGAMYSWVNSGGTVFLNAAPFVANTIYFGNGVYISYDGSNTSTNGGAAFANHPVFAQPFAAGTYWTGNKFSHGVLSGSGLVTLITNFNGLPIAAEKMYGSGSVLYGAMTIDYYHSPQPAAANLRANLLAWAADPRPYVSVNDVAVNEGDSGSSLVTLTLSLSRADTGTVAVAFSTVNDTANNADYAGTNGFVVFPPGNRYQYVSVRVFGDTAGEATERFLLRLQNPTNCVVLKADGAVTIQNDDIYMVTVPFTETWESGIIRPFWNVSGAGTYRTMVVSSNSPRGSFQLTMDSSEDDSPARNDLTLALDLVGKTNVVLKYWAKDFGDEYQAPPPLPYQFSTDFDGVSVSVDNNWWFPVVGINPSSSYGEYTVNLDQITELYGLGYGAPFYVRFTQFDNYAIPTDGIALDDISITAVPRVPSLNVAGSSILAESCSPPNGYLDPLERIVLSVQLQNIGAGPAENLVATLLNSDGVAAATAPVNCGTILPGASTVQQFGFTVQRPCGGILIANLALQDSSGYTDTVSVPLRINSTGMTRNTYANPNPLSVSAASGPASTYPAIVNVTGYSGVPSRVYVTLKGVTHTWPADLDILLMGPRGQSVVLMSDAGGSYDLADLNLTFFDNAKGLPGTQMRSGFYAPGNIGADDTFPVPAPPGPYSAALDVFAGIDPNGAWQLFVVDDASGDSGTIANGWEVTLEKGTPVCCVPAVSLVTGRSGTNLNVQFPTILGQSYTLEYTEIMNATPGWVNWDTFIGDGNPKNYLIPIDPTRNRYFRLKLN